MRKLHYITVESVIGKCEKDYNENLIETETLKNANKSGCLLSYSPSLSNPTSAKSIEKNAKKAYYMGLFPALKS